MSFDRNSLELDLNLLRKAPRWSDESRTRNSSDADSDDGGRDLPILKALGHDDVWLSAPGEEAQAEEDAEDGPDGLGQVGSSPEAMSYKLSLDAKDPSPGTSTQKWDLDAFLLSRSSTLTLSDLRFELRTYLTQLKTELGQLIEDDYEEFISLGLGLRGEGERLAYVRDLLGVGGGENGTGGQSGKQVGLKEEVHHIHSSLLSTQESLSSLLDQRSLLRTERGTTVMLLHLHESLGRVEGLLGVSAGEIIGASGVREMELDEGSDLGYDYDDEDEESEDDLQNELGAPALKEKGPVPDPHTLISSPITSVPSITFPPASTTPILGPSVSLANASVASAVILEVSALGRISSEYRQLMYLVDKAREGGCEVVVGSSGAGSKQEKGEVDIRIDLIRLTLQTQLSTLFATQIERVFARATPAPASRTSTSIAGETKAMNEMYEVLKVYDLIGGWSVAEGVFEVAVERELGKIIRVQALTVAASPGIPDTPYTKTPSANPFSPALAPSTPLGSSMTNGNGNVFEKTLSKPLNPRTQLLNEAESPLAGVYNRILSLVERACVPIMTAGERVRERAAHTQTATAGMAGSESPGLDVALGPRVGNEGSREGFEFLANVVWNQVGGKIIEELGSAVFAAGRVSSLHQNYTLTHRFIDELENLAPSIHAINMLRSHPVYEAFERRWQLPVYFQLRWKEIVTELDASLGTKSAIGSEKGRDGFFLPQTAATIGAMRSCWSSEVFIPELSHRFWRLTLQLLSRYRHWIERSVPALYDTSSRKSFQMNGNGRASFTISRSSTPVANGPPAPSLPTGDPASDPASAAAEDNILKVATLIATDVRKTNVAVRAFWDSEIRRLIANQLEPEEISTVQGALEQALTEIDSLSRAPSSTITNILTRRCTVNVKSIRSVAQQLRAIGSNKSAGQQRQPSPFVTTILRPLRDYFGGIGSELKSAVADDWSRTVFAEVVTSYDSILQGVLETEALVARHRKGKKTGFSLFGSSAIANTANADEEEDRFKRQMLLDLQTLGSEAKALGIHLQGDGDVPGWSALLTSAERSLAAEAPGP